MFACLKKENHTLSPYGDEAVVPAKGIGYACLKFNSSSSLHVLAPSCWVPDADVDTTSTGALGSHSNFRLVSHAALSHMSITDHHNACHRIKVITDKNNLDFVTINVMSPTLKNNNDSSSTATVPTTCHLKSSSTSSAAFLHQKHGHMNHQSLQKLADTGKIKGSPKRIPSSQVKCPLCTIAKGTTIPRNPSDPTKPPVGTRFHADFTFFNVESVRCFACALLIIDAASRHPFGFPSRSKRPPVDTLRWIVNVLRKQGKPFKVLRSDEGGESAHSADFMRACEDLGLIVETTGGCESTVNGTAE